VDLGREGGVSIDHVTSFLGLLHINELFEERGRSVRRAWQGCRGVWHIEVAVHCTLNRAKIGHCILA
jgi:hypothetical protein